MSLNREELDTQNRLEEETIDEVINILRSEFDDNAE